MTGIQEVALAEAGGSGMWNSEVTRVDWWGSCQEGTAALAGRRLKDMNKNKERKVLLVYYTHEEKDADLNK